MKKTTQVRIVIPRRELLDILSDYLKCELIPADFGGITYYPHGGDTNTGSLVLTFEQQEN